MNEKQNADKNKLLYKYIGLATQFLIGIGTAVFLGLKADRWLNFKTPLLVWILPLLVISAIIWQIIKETSKK